MENVIVTGANGFIGKTLVNALLAKGCRVTALDVRFDDVLAYDPRVTCISVGNPHCVTVVDDVDSLKLEDIGPAFEKHPNFPERVNTEFVQVVDATHLKMRVWERGSGETWACGTGTCATVAALTELGICPAGEDIHVQLRGGVLTIRVLPGRQLLMTGAAETVCEGTTEV